MSLVKNLNCPRPVASRSGNGGNAHKNKKVQNSEHWTMSGMKARLIDTLNRIPNPGYYLFNRVPLLLCGGLSLLARAVVAAPIINPMLTRTGVNYAIPPADFTHFRDMENFDLLNVSDCYVNDPTPLLESESFKMDWAMSFENQGSVKKNERNEAERKKLNNYCKNLPVYNNKQKFLVFMSDPQYPWACVRINENCEDEQKATNDNQNHIKSINEIISCLGEKQFGGTVINGDLTAFGHPWQLRKYRSLYDDIDSGIKGIIFPGLGNHDIENNIDDCWRNRCASGMVHYLKEKVAELNPIDFDLISSDSAFFWRTYTGSLAYSWDIGKLHFVQLNNHPTYEAAWQGFNFATFKMEAFRIKSSIPWLKKDLVKAREKGQHIILNYHKPGFSLFPNGDITFDKNAILVDVLRQFNVSAIFAGHHHGIAGNNHLDFGSVDKTYEDLYGAGEHLPVFLGGSVPTQRYVLGHFLLDDGLFSVTVVESDKGINELAMSNKYYPLR